MQIFSFIFWFLILLASCHGKDRSKSVVMDTIMKKTPKVAETLNKLPDTIAVNPAANKLKIALTSNALQLVDAVTGSTKEITFGMPFEKLEPIVNRILEGEPLSIGINTECGAGPLKMATWANGLTLVFKEKKKNNAEWLFAGWFVGKSTGNIDKPKTMSGVGVGSTLGELEATYVTTVTKTSLGQEFSIKSGFYGLLTGKGKKAIIDVMWSGTSCNFR